ncbi:SusC/RagA family TonB-linked outer membrane protein [Zobellia sp. OII3]|uniref:SusC/RagA family TonB-linked outer membrane protein n=1 Tax=Zobellia sp. OII3 TaxID=2034520 RepID=UPI00191BBCC8|nr:TonB-dependent receptor [Zobellia sp. OII3]
MKLTVLLTIISLFQIQANTYSQSKKISLDMPDATVQEVIQEIEQLSDYKFLLNRKDVDLYREVSIKVKKKLISTILNELFEGTNIRFEVLHKQIILKKAKIPIKKPVVLPLTGQSLPVIDQFSVSGMVTDEDGNPLPGANIVEKGTTNGVTADFDGNFSIELADENATLVISYIGFSTMEVSAEGQANINVQLKESAAGLEEVVVVGYGTQKKVTLTGAISNLKGEEVLKSPTTNVSQALGGRMAGVTTVQRSGEPGADDTVIRIRGSNTLGDNSALVVVDGVPGRSLSRIDPNSIESITVLKDVSAAIYGSQAANGVILVKTKRGRLGKPSLTFNYNQGFNQPTRIPEMANGSEYARLQSEIDIYAGRSPRYSDEEIAMFSSNSDSWLYPNTDWFDEVLKPWSGQKNVNGQISGGGEYVNYFISGGYKFQDAYYRNSVSNYKQYDFRTNIDGKFSDNISWGVDLYGRFADTNSPTQGFGAIFRTTTVGNPNIPAVWPDGSPGPDILGGQNPVTISTGAAGFDETKNYSLNSSFKLNFKIPWIEGLSLNLSTNFDKSFENRKRFETPWEVNSWDQVSYDANDKPILNSAMVPFNDPRLTQYSAEKQSLLTNAVMNYETTFNEIHNIKLLGGVESREDKGGNFNAFRRHYVSSTTPELFAGGDQDKDNTGGSYESARLNYFGRLNYNFKEKLLFEFVWRYDGSYIFPEENRFGFFPGVSLGWRMSEEKFWKENLSFVDEFKIRTSYGQTGNDRIGEWQYLASYGYSDFIYNFGVNESYKLLFEERIPNENVSWEVANQFDIGIESYFLDKKLYFDLTFFDYRRSDILWWRNASVPTSAGINLPRENIGKVTNQGFDFNLSYRGNINDLGYSVGLNGGYAKNKITFWDESPGRPEWQQSTGKPIPTVPEDIDQDLYYVSEGIFNDQAEVDATPHWEGARPGDIIFKDVNEDGVINGLDRVRDEKNNIPRFSGGLNLALNYKQFDFSMLFQGAAGAVRYISTESGLIGNFLKDYYDNRWTPDNPDAPGPRAHNRDSEYWRNNRNTYFLRKSDYLRLKTLELGYNLPQDLCDKFGSKGTRLYVNGYNLLTYSPDLKDFDPESDQRSLSGGSQPYPVQRVINGGIEIKF